jgi:hypothetical protein
MVGVFGLVGMSEKHYASCTQLLDDECIASDFTADECKVAIYNTVSICESSLYRRARL